MDAGSDVSDEGFGALLRRYRLTAGLTQEALAERASMSVRGISDLERGARTRPQRETVKLLVAALDLSEADHARLLAASRTAPQRVSNPLPGHAVASGAGLSARAALPISPHPLIGREQEVAAVIRFLHDPAVRLLTLTGPGGVGKTRLALAIAHAARSAFPDGVVFVDLSPLRDPDLVPGAIAEGLKLQEDPGSSPLASVMAALRSRQVLVVLDNVEQVVAAVPAIAELLAGCPHLTVLATSRVPLRLRGEREYPVGPLAVPPPLPSQSQARDTVGMLLVHPAAALFVERARAVKPSFVVDTTNANDIAAICQRLDGLPLALELAAAWTKLLPPATMLNRLQAGRMPLTGGARDLPERQQTIRATIAWSYDLLTPEQQWLFRHLAVFVGGWTLEAAEAVVAKAEHLPLDVLDGLRNLVDHSLVVEREHPTGEPRFALLETIREFALDRLTASGEAHAAGAHHAAYFREFAETAGPHLEQVTLGAWIPRLIVEHANVRAAVSWLAAHGHHAEVLRIGVALWNFWFEWYPAEGLAWLEAALDVEPDDPWLRSAALFAAGNLARQVGDPRRGQTHQLEELELRRSLGDDAGIGKTLLALGVQAAELDDLDWAEELLLESAERLRQTADSWAYGIALSALASVASERGAYAQARRFRDDALAVHRERGDLAQVAYELNLMGWYAVATGEYAHAQSLFEQSLHINQSVGGPRRVRDDLEGLAEVAIAQGDLEHAEALLAEGARLSADGGRSFYLPLLAGRLARTREEYAGARTAYAEALALVEATDNRRADAMIDVFLELAACAADVSRSEAAVQLVRVVVGLHAVTGRALSPYAQAEYDRIRSVLCSDRGAQVLEVAAAQHEMQVQEELIATGLAVATQLLTDMTAFP